MRSALWALSDQAGVSSANFLTIAIGAWFLDLPEQGKLIYVYTAYIALVLFNASVLFSAAPVLRYEVASPLAYRRQLFHIQIGIAVIGAGAFGVFFVAAGPYLGWVPTMTELVSISGFLLLQQLADFNRRAEYVFGDIRTASSFSMLILFLRIGALVVLNADTAETFFLLLGLASLPGAISAIVKEWGAGRHELEGHMLRRHMHMARWNVVNAPLQWAGLHLPVLLAGALASPSAAAVLASVRSISTVSNIFLELIETYVPAWMTSHARRHGGAGVRTASMRLYALGGGLWLIVALVIIALRENLLALLLGAAYAGHWPVLLVLWVGNGLYFLGRVCGVRYRVVCRTSVEPLGSLGGVAVLLASLPLISHYGAMGGAWVIVLVQLGIVMSQLVYTRRFMRQDPV